MERVGGAQYVAVGLNIPIRFYVWAHPNQMPLRKVVLDKTGHDISPTVMESESFANKKLTCAGGWCQGGGSRWDVNCDPSQGVDNNPVCQQLKNYLNESGNFTCKQIDPSDAFASFGSTPTTGCSQGYVEFFMDLSCSQADAKPILPAEGLLVQSALSLGYIPNKVCKFKPRVHVMDNWGWCSGSCVSENVPGYRDTLGLPYLVWDGCYSEIRGQANAPGDCDTDTTKPWVQYPDPIIVVPTQ